MRRALFAVVAAAALAACQASYPSLASPSTPAKLQIHAPSAIGPVRLASGFRLAAYLLNSDGAYEDVTPKASWSVSDPTILSRSTTIATTTVAFVATGVGTTDITAQYQGLSSSVTIVTVLTDRPAYPMLTVSPGDPQVIGRSAAARAILQINPSESQVVTPLASWDSSDPAVATVGSDGMVNAVAPGTTLITALYNGFGASYLMSVDPRR